MVVFDEERRIAELRAQKTSVQQEIINALEMKMQLGKVFDEVRRIAELRAQKTHVQLEITNALEMKMVKRAAVGSVCVNWTYVDIVCVRHC